MHRQHRAAARQHGVNAAAANTGSAATLTAAMKDVPTLVGKLNAELKRADG